MAEIYYKNQVFHQRYMEKQLGGVEIVDTGINNKLFLPDCFTITERGALCCFFKGNGNQVILRDNVVINGKVTCSFLPQCNMAADYSCIFVGESTFINGKVDFSASAPNTIIKVGNDCLFANNIVLTTTDNHMIYDIDSQAVLNSGGDIKIGNHVWICEGVKILNNVKIPANSVVATRCLVTKTIEEENVVIGGIPAKVIRRNCNWSREWKL